MMNENKLKYYFKYLSNASTPEQRIKENQQLKNFLFSLSNQKIKQNILTETKLK